MNANHTKAHTEAVDRIRRALLETARVQLWPNPTGFDPRAKRDYGIGKGGADLVGLVRHVGRFFAAEVKTGGGELEPDQIRWHRSVRANGGFACVVHTEAEAVAALSRAAEFMVGENPYTQAPFIGWKHFE